MTDDERIEEFIREWALRAEMEGGGTAIFVGIVGSRGMGLAHAGSDWDVTGFYLRPPLEYLTTKHTKPGHLFTFKMAGGEFHFHDFRRVLQLLLDSNPTMLESLQTTLVVQETPLIGQLREWAAANYSPIKLVHHYGSIVKEHVRRYIANRQRVERKEVLHAVRAAVCAYHVLYQKAIPPLDVRRLVNDTTLDPQVRLRAVELLNMPPGEIVPNAYLLHWLNDVIGLYRGMADEAGHGTLDTLARQRLDDLFRLALAESYGRYLDLEGTAPNARQLSRSPGPQRAAVQ